MWQHTYGPPHSDGDSCSWARHKCKWVCWCHVQTQIHMLSKHSIPHHTAAAFNHPWAMAGYETCHVAGLMVSAETQRLCPTRDEQAHKAEEMPASAKPSFCPPATVDSVGVSPQNTQPGFNLLQQSVPRPTLAGFEAIRSAGRRSEEHSSLPTLTSGGEAERGRGLRRVLTSCHYCHHEIY